MNEPHTNAIDIQALGILYNIRLKRAEAASAKESFDDLESFVPDISDEDGEEDSQNTNESEESTNE